MNLNLQEIIGMMSFVAHMGKVKVVWKMDKHGVVRGRIVEPKPKRRVARRKK